MVSTAIFRVLVFKEADHALGHLILLEAAKVLIPEAPVSVPLDLQQSNSFQNQSVKFMPMSNKNAASSKT